MAPKKSPQVNENIWRTTIEQSPLNETDWSVNVVLIEAAGSDQDRIYLNKFETFAAEEKRFVIKNICKTETIFMINQLGSDKKVKDESLRVFEEGNAYLKEKKEIPPEILALTIKHLVLKMKEEYLFIKRQRLEVKEGMRKESSTMVNKAEVKPTVTAFLNAVAAAEAAEESPPVTLIKGAPNENPVVVETKKFNTLLRERGEEWRDKVYVDDFPVDGPNLYVAVTGFLDPHLPGCLVKIGIPLTAVVQIRIDATTTMIPTNLFRSTKRGQSQTEILASQSLEFWNVLQLLRIQEQSASDFNAIAFIVFTPPYWQENNLSGEADQIYDELCFLMYDIQDLSRQHMHYLDNMDIVNVPEHSEKEIYKHRYHTLIDDIPLESVTIYSVLDSILAIACKSHEIEEIITTSLSSAITINIADSQAKTENFVKEVFNTLCKTEADKKSYRLTYGEEYENHKDPIVIKYGDSAKYSTFHLGNIHLDQIVYSSLLGIPVHKLWLGQDRPSEEHEAKLNFHVNVLLSCFEREDVETAEFTRLLHILACRKLYNNRSSLKKDHLPPTTVADFKTHYLKRSILAKPLQVCSSVTQANLKSPRHSSITKSEEESISSYSSDDPEVQRIKFLFDCPDISELVSAAEIAANHPIKHIIDDFDYFEDFADTNAFQMMSEGFNKFNCVDYKFCEVTDCFILMFFNNHNKDGISRDEWHSHLRTPICLQDFFDYVLEENYDWIQEEEKSYDKKMLMSELSESKHLIDPTLLQSCVKYEDVGMDMLLEGSIKYNELIQAEESSQITGTDVTFDQTSKKTTVTSTTDGQSSRKTKSPMSNTPKIRKLVLNEQSAESATCIKIPKKTFLGYDLGDRRVGVLGKDSIFFSRDGTKISSCYSLTIPMNLEYIILNITPGNSFNEFWVHKALGEFVRPDIIDTCESFRITTKDQMLINIKEQSYTAPIHTSFLFDNVQKLSSSKLKSSKLSFPKMTEDKHFHSLYISWPNGMITESVHETNSFVLSHIKQYHVGAKPDPDEDMRCISLIGEVIIFKRCGTIEVLKPDGSLVKITKYHKEPIVNEPSYHLVPSDTASNKKAKTKVSKSALKASKHAMAVEAGITSNETVREYKLLITEFESIDTNGLRQVHKNDTFVNIEKLLIRTATDYCLGEIFSRRMDGTSVLLNKDGVLLVTFPNKTRIITRYQVDDEEIYPEWTDEERLMYELLGSEVEVINSGGSDMSRNSYNDSEFSRKVEEEESKEKKRLDGYVYIHMIYSIEHAHFSTVTVNKFNGTVSVDSPNGTTVTLDQNNHYSFTLDPVTTAQFDGQKLHISYEACPQCKSFTTCNVVIKPDNSECDEENWVMAKDSFCKRVSVNNEGNIETFEETCSENVDEENIFDHASEVIDMNENQQTFDSKPADAKSEISESFHGRCRELYLAKTIRFFVMKRDLSCSELIHRSLVDNYQQTCRWQPWCSINEYDSFGDNRSLVALLTPIHLTEAEKWLMDSKLADKPKYLTFKDLKEDTGKGFYHWMRPYERFEPKPMKPENVLPPRLPRAYILRTLEKQWKDPMREDLKGARELLEAILRYRLKMETDSDTLLHIPIIDRRTAEERSIDDHVQAIAHEIYEDIKKRLNEDVQTRATPTITTKPKPRVPKEMVAEGEFAGEEESESKVEDEQIKSVVQMEQAAPMSPNLVRYWRKRAEELKEEEFFKYLLREGGVPPYFRNILGGAIWWEMNNLTDEAMTKAERRQMTCVCNEDKKNSNGEVGSQGYSVQGPFM